MFEVKVGLPDLNKIEEEMLAASAKNITSAMYDATEFLKDQLRQQVTGAGMGQRLARTWGSEVYPKGGRSLGPAGYVWSKAPEIIDAFSRGVTIQTVNGEGWLWIPTKKVPPRRMSGVYKSTLRKRGRGTRMSPEEVELHFNSELIVVPGKRGSMLAFIDVVRSNNGRTFRQATARRVKGRKGMAARPVKRVLMFVLVRQAKMPKRFDLQAAADQAGRFFVSLLQ